MTPNEQIESAVETLIENESGEKCLREMMAILHAGHDSQSPNWEAIETIAQAMRSSPDRSFIETIEERLSGGIRP